MAVRLIDVAARAGVSIATASRSLNGVPGVSPELASEVQRVAASMGYVANSHARTLAGGREASIGLVVGGIDDPYFSELAAGVIKAAAGTGRAVQIAHAGSPEEIAAQVRLFRSNGVGAIVLAGSGSADPELDRDVETEAGVFAAAGGRIVVVGRHAIGAPAVEPQNREGGRLLGEHLLGLGHRRVAVVAGPADLSTIVDRLAGLTEALGDAVVSVTHHDFTRDGGVEGARLALALTPKATAIAALSDVLAVGVLRELRSRGVAVPQDVAVTGFDDVSLAADLSPALTTVRIDLVAIGSDAVLLADPDRSDAAESIIRPVELVVRGSSVTQ